jgi:hypothetical protein
VNNDVSFKISRPERINHDEFELVRLQGARKVEDRGHTLTDIFYKTCDLQAIFINLKEKIC